MSFEDVFGEVRPRALIARMPGSLFRGVSDHMLLQVAFLRELLRAILTFVWLLACMRSVVVDEVPLLGKALLATVILADKLLSNTTNEELTVWSA